MIVMANLYPQFIRDSEGVRWVAGNHCNERVIELGVGGVIEWRYRRQSKQKATWLRGAGDKLFAQ